MKDYELLSIVSGGLAEAEATKVSDDVGNALAKLGGKAEEDTVWGRRRLAYEIGKDDHGWYVITRFSMDPAKVDEFQKALNLNAKVIRTVLVNASEVPTPEEAAERVELMERIAEAFEREQMASRVGFTHEERAALGNIPLITLKPSLVVANVNEEDVAHPSKNDFYQQAETWAEENGAGLVAVSAKIESELSVMEESEAAEFLESLGLEESNLDRFIRAAYQLLGLITFYTAGPKEARAWPIPKDSTAPQAAGAIHTDFQQKFIRADVISYDDYVAAGSESAAAAAGKQRSEGKDYVVQDGDVLLIKHGA